jgi:hypothetical protein
MSVPEADITNQNNEE